jgi:hypothetical protein
MGWYVLFLPAAQLLHMDHPYSERLQERTTSRAVSVLRRPLPFSYRGYWCVTLRRWQAKGATSLTSGFLPCGGLLCLVGAPPPPPPPRRDGLRVDVAPVLCRCRLPVELVHHLLSRRPWGHHIHAPPFVLHGASLTKETESRIANVHGGGVKV